MTASLLVVLAGGVAGAVLLWRLPLLPDAPAEGTRSGTPVSVVIAARDEATSLPTLLTSLAAQHVRPLEVIVVDDGSTDGTAAIATAAGAHVVASGGPAPGWTGKTWACDVGVRAATSDLLVLLDADTWLAPDALGRLLAAHVGLPGDGLVSVQPFHVTHEPHEQLSALANVVPLLASGIAAVRPPRASAVAFGPCLVTSRRALDEVGGFGAVRAHVAEDIALAGAYERAGRPVRCFAGGAVIRFRMYPDGLRSLVQGWTKNLAVGAASTPLVATLGAVLWVCALVTAAIAPFTYQPWGLAVYAAMAGELWWMLRRVGSFRWWTWAAFPIPVAAFVALFLRSVVVRVLHRPVWWRGRQVGVDR